MPNLVYCSRCEKPIVSLTGICPCPAIVSRVATCDCSAKDAEIAKLRAKLDTAHQPARETAAKALEQAATCLFDDMADTMAKTLYLPAADSFERNHNTRTNDRIKEFRTLGSALRVRAAAVRSGEIAL